MRQAATLLPPAEQDPTPEPIQLPPRTASGAAASTAEDQVRRFCLENLARLLKRACREYLNRRFTPCSEDCGRILQAFPTYAVPLILRDLADRSRHALWMDPQFFDATVDDWIARTSDNPDHPALPEFDPSQLPESGILPATANRLAFQRLLEGEELEDADDLAIRRTLDTMKIDLKFKQTKLEDILSFIRDFSGLNIVVDADVQGAIDPERLLDFAVRDLSLKYVLKLLMSQFGLDYTVTEEHVVLLTSPARATRAR